jgi:hypothetical protein
LSPWVDGTGPAQVIFLEHVSSSALKRNRHFAIHCVPLPRRAAEQAPGYYKKAILEAVRTHLRSPSRPSGPLSLVGPLSALRTGRTRSGRSTRPRAASTRVAAGSRRPYRRASRTSTWSSAPTAATRTVRRAPAAPRCAAALSGGAERRQR